MAKITLEIDDTLINRFIDGVCNKYGYEPTIRTNNTLIPNPVTKDGFVENFILTFLLEGITISEATAAGAVAHTAKAKEVKETFDKKISCVVVK